MIGWLWGHHQVLAVGVGGLLVVALAALVVRRLRGVAGDRLAVLAASGVAMALSAQGSYVLLTTHVGLPSWEAAIVCAVAELALVAEVMRAERSIRVRSHHGGHAQMVWMIAVGAGVVVGVSAPDWPSTLVRVAIPLLVAGLWWSGVREGAQRPADAITWRVTPRRLLVLVGLAQPGSADLVSVDRARRARVLARLIHRHRTGAGWLRARRAARVLRLAEDTDVDIIADVRARLSATADILSLAGLSASADTADTGGRTVSGQGEDMVSGVRGLHAVARPVGSVAGSVRAAVAVHGDDAAAVVAAVVAAHPGVEPATVRRTLRRVAAS